MLGKRRLMHNSASKRAVQNPLHRPTYTYAESDTHKEHTLTKGTHSTQDIVIGTRCSETMISPPPGLSVCLSFTHFHFSFFSLHLSNIRTHILSLSLSSFVSPSCTLCNKSANTNSTRTNTHSCRHICIHTRLASQSRFLLSLAFLPPHFFSKDSTGEP